MQLTSLAKTKRRRIIIIGIIMAAGISFVGIYHLFYQKQVQNEKKLVTAVHAVSAEKKDLLKNISLVGQTVPKAQVDIAAKYPGKIENVSAALGQQVSSGQVLIREDADDAALTVSVDQHAYNQAVADARTTQVQLNANYDKAKADYDKAFATYQRNKNVYDVGGISADDMDTAQQQVEDARAALNSIENQMDGGTASSVTSAQENIAKAKSSLAAAQKQKNDMYLTSSINGTIGYRQVEAGDMVTAGQKLLSVYDNSVMYVDYQVSEQDLPAFSLGNSLSVNIESLSNSFDGSIIYISPTIDSSTMTYVLRVSVENPDGLLRGGMFAHAVLKSILRSNVITVPKAAVIAKNGKNYVFIINADNTVTQKEISVGASGDEDEEIISGLSDGENVAVDNLSRLKDGMKINPLGDGSDGQ
ncbi:efflux RND transporter periplasmic adaptor subunit [Pectinatus haikarae]|uniref:Multidrug efflux pump subunit AcrA (Membrane-fusion protein) n=1 Tax=Pectinatus haikarae TaxID=349096 RepID=A0ABT9Y8F6_9FIRM|nr:efflux RND transporter periplasmic adaptor subunit [Pectinatus haikarae]MDQ0203923.1 multidrug efflux pump subunit AcrA (membrane-fusion protein) [Pectinatus haikarae]